MLLSAHFQRLSGLMCAGITAQMNTTGLKLSFFQRSDLSAVSLILKVFSSFLTPEQVRTVGVMFWPKCLHWCGSNYIYHFPLQKSQFHNNWLHNYLIKVALIDWLLYVMGKYKHITTIKVFCLFKYIMVRSTMSPNFHRGLWLLGKAFFYWFFHILEFFLKQ